MVETQRLTRVLCLLLATAVAGALPCAPAAAAPPPVAKDMTFFLHYVNATETAKSLPGAGSTWTYFDTTTDWSAANVTLSANGSLQTFDWYLAPPLAGTAAVSAFSLSIWSQFISGVPNAQTSVELAERASSGTETTVATANFGSVTYASTASLKQLNWTLSSPHTFSAGSSVKVSLKVNPGGGAMDFIFDSARADSRFTIVTANSARFTAVALLNATGDGVPALDPAAANTTALLRATLDDPYGGYDIASARATVLSPSGAPLVDNATMTQVSGTPASLSSAFELPWNYTGLPSGRYLALFFAMDNNGLNWYAHFAHFDYGPYGDATSLAIFVGEPPLFAWVRLLDDRGAALEGADVTLLGAPGPGASGRTDASGLVNLSAGPGNYTLEAIWTGTEVARLPLTLSSNISALAPLEVGASVFYPTLRLVDNRSLPLADAAVTYTHPNGTNTLTPLATAADGTVSLGRTAGGAYRVLARWETVAVLDATWVVNASATTTIAARVFSVEFHVLDSRGAGVAFAALVAREALTGVALDYTVTDAFGVALTRLPGTAVDVAAWVRDLQIVDARGLAIGEDGRVDLAAAVYYVTLTVLDSRGVPLAGAQITLRSEGGIAEESLASNAAGAAELRAPAANYTLSISWLGAAVAAEASFAVQADLAKEINASVYYAGLLGLDSRALPVAGAVVALRGLAGPVAVSGALDAAGHALFRVPGGTYNLSIQWSGEAVFGDGAFAVAADVNQTFTLSVFYLSLRLVDTRSAPLDGAVARALGPAGEELASGTTGPDGGVLLRLPGGTPRLLIAWSGVLIFNASLTVSADLSVALTASVAYLDVEVVDREGRPLHDVFLAVTREGADAGPALSTTGTSGTASFRLPAGRYHVSARLVATYLLSPIDQTEDRAVDIGSTDANLTIVMTRFQPELVATNAFAVAVLFLVSVASMAAFVYLRYQRPQRPDEDEGGPSNTPGALPPPPPSP